VFVTAAPLGIVVGRKVLVFVSLALVGFVHLTVSGDYNFHNTFASLLVLLAKRSVFVVVCSYQGLCGL